MLIGVNCLEVKPQYVGGVNTYVMGVLSGLCKGAGNHRLRIFVTRRNRAHFARFEQHSNCELVCVGSAWLPTKRLLWQLSSALQSAFLFTLFSRILFSSESKKMQMGIDVLYIPTASVLPLPSGIPTIWSMHDLQHMRYPKHFSVPQLLWRRMLYPAAARAVAKLQASTNAMKHEFVECLPQLREGQIEVIQEGTDIEAFSTVGVAGAAKDKLGLAVPFLFYPAQLWPHKNHIQLLKALAVVRQRCGLELPLVLTGQKFGAANSIAEYARRNNMSFVRFLGKVSFGDLKALYREAHFVISPSLYESSNLCFLEGAASGAPLLGSRIPAHVEMATRLKITLFEPNDAQGLAALLEGIWFDEKLRNEHVIHNKRAIEYYSWTNVADKYLQCFAKVAESARE